MVLPFLHHVNRINDLATKNQSPEQQVDHEWVIVEVPASEEAVDVKELEKYMTEMTDPSVLEKAVKEAEGPTQA